MTPALTGCAAELTAALREALRVEDAQTELAEAARKWADLSRDRLQQFLTRDPDEQSRPHFADFVNVEAIQAEGRESAVLGARWEAAFCSIYEALMRLYAYPEARPIAERIAAKVREVRLLQVEDVGIPTMAPAIGPAPPSAPGPDATPEEREAFTRERRDRMLQFMRSTDSHVDELGHAFRDRAACARHLLRAALAEAEALVSTP